MLQTIQSQRSFVVVSVCAMGSQLLKKCDEPSVIYRAPKPAPVAEAIVVRIEPKVEIHAEPQTPITIIYRGGGCALHGSRLVYGFGKNVQIRHGFDTRKVIKSMARNDSGRRRGLRAGVNWLDKSQSWKDRGGRKQWE
jgi:hypothetical protein